MKKTPANPAPTGQTEEQLKKPWRKKNRAYGFGYGRGQHPKDLLKACVEMGAILVDVRFKAASRNPLWRKAALERLFGDRYRHVPELGNIHFKGGGPMELADEEAGIEQVLDLIEQGPVILMCQCPDVATCHRMLVLTALSFEGVKIDELYLDGE